MSKLFLCSDYPGMTDRELVSYSGNAMESLGAAVRLLCDKETVRLQKIVTGVTKNVPMSIVENAQRTLTKPYNQRYVLTVTRYAEEGFMIWMGADGGDRYILID